MKKEDSMRSAIEGWLNRNRIALRHKNKLFRWLFTNKDEEQVINFARFMDISNEPYRLVEHGKKKEALILINQLLEEYPDNTVILNNMAMALRRLKRYEEAISLLERSLNVQMATGESENLVITRKGRTTSGKELRNTIAELKKEMRNELKKNGR